jgi:hypothetical protein
MRFHFLLAGFVGVALLILAPDASAHGGGGGGSGGHGGGNFHGGSGFHGGGRFHGGFHGRGRFFHGRFFGPGFAFYGYGYPWWGWDYPYYPYSYYDDAYDSGSYGDNGSYGANDPRFKSPRAVQAALAWRGFYSGRIDGVMGPETSSAIRSFQAQQGLPVTGQIDDRLINALRR